MTKAILLAGFCAALLGQQVDIDGWAAAKFGMNPKEVEAAVGFPLTQTELDKTIRDDGREHFSSKDLIPVYRFKMRVYFSFVGNKLIEVQLGAQTSASRQAVFDVLKEALVTKYGAPREQGRDALWVFRSGSILLYSSGTLAYKKAESQPLL